MSRTGVLLAVTTALNILIAVLLPHFPYGDTANHVARYTLISASWKGSAPGWIHFHWIPTAYIALDALGAAIAFALGPSSARFAIVALYLAALPLGTYQLFKAVAPQEAPWAMIASVLAFNWYFLTGFLSYSVGIALALVWLAWWWPRRDSRTYGTLVLGSLAAGILYMIHMSSAATVACVLGAWCLEPLFIPNSDKRSRSVQVASRASVALAYLACAIALHLLMKFDNAFPPPASDALVFRDAGDKLRHFATPFASFSATEAALVGGAYVIAIVVRLSLGDTRNLRPVWATSVAVLILSYLAFPLVAFGAWDVDIRFLLPALILAFLIVPSASRVSRKTAIASSALTLVAVAHSIFVLAYGVAIERRIDQLLRLARTAPQHARILVLDASEDDFFRIDAFTHAGEWLLTADADARVNGLFSGGPNGSYLAHFIVDSLPYDPGVHWQRKGFPQLPWQRVDADYSFILLEGNAPAALHAIETGADPVARIGQAELFRTRCSSPASICFSRRGLAGPDTRSIAQ